MPGRCAGPATRIMHVTRQDTELRLDILRCQHHRLFPSDFYGCKFKVSRIGFCIYVPLWVVRSKNVKIDFQLWLEAAEARGVPLTGSGQLGADGRRVRTRRAQRWQNLAKEGGTEEQIAHSIRKPWARLETGHDLQLLWEISGEHRFLWNAAEYSGGSPRRVDSYQCIYLGQE